MSLQLRLNLSLGILTAVIVSALVGAVLLDGPPRMRMENQTMMRLTSGVITSSLPALVAAGEPLPGIERMIAGLASLRHVNVHIDKPGMTPTTSQAGRSPNFFPDTAPDPVKIPIVKDGAVLGSITISARPADELDELWQSADKIVAYGAVLIGAMIVLNSLVIRWSLAPVASLNDAIRRLKHGQFATIVPAISTPELSSIGAGLNELSVALSAARQDNARLTHQLVSLQEEERKGLARDLHDEIGASLFVSRAKVALLLKELGTSHPDVTRVRTLSTDVSEEIERLQQTNRRILQSLTPPALAELGLRHALDALVALWQKSQPFTSLRCRVTGDTSLLDETLKITIYRVVQEALTNAYRHGRPSQIDATVDIATEQNTAASLVSIEVRDNGCGLSKGSIDGFGISGMRNRVRGLSGTFDIRPAEPSGVIVKATLPLPRLDA